MSSRLRGMWLVADMDGTLTLAPHRAGGAFPSLTESPCHAPVLKWLAQGGRLALITTAGPRTVSQVWDAIPPLLRASRRVVLGTYSGALLCAGDADGNLVEDVAFRETMRTCLPRTVVPRILDILRAKVLEFLKDASEDPTLIPLLSVKYHGPFQALAGMTSEEREKVLTMEALCTSGAFISQPQYDTVLDVQRLFTDESEVGQITMMGIPMSRFGKYFTPDVLASITSHDLFVKSQPNSVCIGVSAVSKDIIVRWMAKTPAYEFSLSNAIAIADTPDGPDKPLTEMPPMPFVSVAPSNKAGCGYYVGQEEVGSARWMENVLALQDPTAIVTDAAALGVSVKASAKL